MADLKERIKVWKDYIKEHHNEYIKESLTGFPLGHFIWVHLGWQIKE